MKKEFIYAAIKNRTITLFMIALVAVAGIYCYYISPRQESPDVSAPVAKITAIYPGASPEDVDKLVTSKIEDELHGINGYDYCTSYSQNSISVVMIFLNDNVDIDKAWDELRRRMSDIQAELPEQCGKIEVNTDLVNTAGMIISLSGDGYSYEQLASYGEDFKDELMRIDGVSRFDIVGKQEKEVGVRVDIVAVFIPLLLLPGAAGEFLSSIPIICIVALSASYIVALFVTPTISYLMFKKSISRHRESKIRAFFSFTLDAGMKHKVYVVIIAVVLLIASLNFVRILGLQFFAKADKNIIYINFKCESAYDLDATEIAVNRIEDLLAGQKEISCYTTAIGDGLPKFFFTVQPGSQSVDYAQIMVRVDLKKGNRFTSNAELADYLQGVFDRNITEGTATVKLLENGKPIGDPVQFRVLGDDMDVIAANARKIEDELRKTDGTVNVMDDYQDKEYEFFIDIDSDTAFGMGFTNADIQKQVSIVLKGMTASVYRKDGNESNIVVKGDIGSIEELENLSIKSSATGNKVLLKQLTDVKLKLQAPKIQKYDRELAVTVTSGVRPGYSSVSIQNRLQDKFESMDLDNVRIVPSGEKEAILDSFGDLGIFAVFAMFIIFMLLMIQFKSLIQPLIVMVTIPLAVIGSIFGLLVFGMPISFTALFGIVSLVGIVVNNAIILVDYINGEMESGKSIGDSCRGAASKRFRPVMLTTATTVMGLIPLAFSWISLFGPMAVALMFGLLIATFLTLVVIPVVFSMVMGYAEKAGQKIRVRIFSEGRLDVSMTVLYIHR